MSAALAQAPLRPGRDPLAELHPASAGHFDVGHLPTHPHVAVVGGGIAGLSAAVALAERGVRVSVLEREPYLGGRAGAWAVPLSGGNTATMSRGFHAFFRQYYNLRSLLRRSDPGLARLVALPDYPLWHRDGARDTFATLPTTPPWNLAAFVARSPTFGWRDLRRVHLPTALGLLDVTFPAMYADLDSMSAAAYLDRLRFPAAARDLALEVFSRSFFADPADFSAAEMVAMFHAYFTGSSEGLLFDVPSDSYEAALWAPLRGLLRRRGVDVRTGTVAQALVETPDGIRIEGSGVADVDAVVLATDVRGLRELVANAEWLGDGRWRDAVAGLRTAPPFAVWRLWLDRAVDHDRGAFVGTSGYGSLDNVSVLERFEAESAAWALRSGGSVVELHAYALPPGVAETQLRSDLRTALRAVYPETAGARAVDEQWLVRDDCPLHAPGTWADRPRVSTPDPRVVLAGDGIRCDLPVALMERAATTGFQAANQLLASWGVTGHDLWSVPTRPRHAVFRWRRRQAARRSGT